MEDKINNMKVKAFAVIDTNVFISFLMNPESDSAVAQIGRLVNKGNVIPLYDERMLSEYYSVLNYAKFDFLPEIVEQQMSVVLSKGIFVNNVRELNIHFKDETDIPFYEVAMDTKDFNSDLVTGNTAHYPPGGCISPQQLINQMSYMETFIAPLKTIDYQKAVKDKILQLTSTGKYCLGEILPKEYVEKLKERRLESREHIPLNEYIK